MNKAIVMGNLTDDPKIRETSNGKKVASFTLAVNRVGEGTDYLDFTAWEQKAEFVERYCYKGMKLLAEGRIQTGTYEKDGTKIKRYDIVAERLEFCEKKKDQQPRTNDPDGFMQIPEGMTEEMPFT